MSPQGEGMGAAGRGEVRCDNQWDASQSERSDHRKPDRAAPEHDGRLVPDRSGSVNGVQSDCDRFRESGQLRVDAARNREHSVRLHQQTLRERTGEIVRIAKGNDPSGPPGNGMADYGRPRNEPADSSTDLDDPARELVAEHHVGIGVEVEETETGSPCCADEIVRVPTSVQIGSADPAGNGLEEHVPGKNRELTNLVNLDGPLPKNCGFHILPTSGRAISAK